MNNCNNKTKYTCGDSIYATCVNVESAPNSQSSLVSEQCISQEDFNEDIYGQLEDIWTENDLEALGELCLSYTEISGKKVVKNVLLKFEEKICELQERILELETTAICSTSIQDCNFTLGDLVDGCNEPPTTLKDLLQILINQHITP